MQGLLSFGRSIQEFKNKQIKQIFEQASTYPPFFDKHLVHPLRRIKVFHHDANANIRAFYFQYLMLCFEIENQNYQFYISKIHKFLLDPNFTFLFLEDDDQLIFNDKQFKRFLFEFMEILDSGEYQSTQAALNHFNIADIVFVYFFRSLAIYAEITTDFDSYIDKTILFGFLLENFNIDAQIFEEKCIKFIQAQVFVYQDSPTEIYLVYKDIQTTLSSSNHSKLSNSVDQAKKLSQSLSSSKRRQESQVQQNISMLQADLLNSQTNSGEQVPISVTERVVSERKKNSRQDSSFKKNKMDEYRKFSELEQKPSLLSRNEQSRQLQQQIQYSFKNSELEAENKRQGQENKDFVNIHRDNHQYELHEESSHSVKQQPHVGHNNEQHNQIAGIGNNFANGNNYNIKNNLSTQKGYGHGSNSQGGYSNFNKEQLESQIGSITTGVGLDLKQNNFELKTKATSKGTSLESNWQSGRDKISSSYGDKAQIKGAGWRNHSNTVVQGPSGPWTSSKYNSESYGDGVKTKTNVNVNLNVDGDGNVSKYSSVSNTQMNENMNKNEYSYQSNEYHSYDRNSNGYQQANSYEDSGYNTPLPIQPSRNKYQLNSQYYDHTPNYNHSSNTHNLTKDPYQAPKSNLTHLPPTRDISQPTTNNNTSNNYTSSNYTSSNYTSSNNYAHTQKQHNYNGPSNLSGYTQSKDLLNVAPQKALESSHYQSYKMARQTASNLPFKDLSSAPTSLNMVSPSFSTRQTGYDGAGRQMRQDSIPTKQSRQRFRQIIVEKLSVSKEFTDSLTLMKMGQPYNSNIKKIKARSRQFRQSIISAFI